MRKCSVGGQGVIEGIMMRSPELSAIAVRKESGQIVYQKKKLTPPAKKYKILGWPVIRGVVAFISSLAGGVSTISDSAKMYDEGMLESEKPSKFEEFVARKTGKNAFDVMMYFAVVIALAVGIGLFFLLPNIIANLFTPFVTSAFLMNLIEGAIRLAIFIGYMVLITLMKDIRRVFAYHGAEHKTIHCYEHEEELTCENIQKYKTLHPRCGTSYLFLVMAVSILLFACLGWSSVWYLRMGIRLLFIPVVAGIAYEVLKFAAKYENWFTRAIRAPGLALQRLTTRQPDDSMVEVAIVALHAAMDEMGDEGVNELCEKYARGKYREERDASDTAADDEPSGGEPT